MIRDCVRDSDIVDWLENIAVVEADSRTNVRVRASVVADSFKPTVILAHCTSSRSDGSVWTECWTTPHACL